MGHFVFSDTYDKDNPIQVEAEEDESSATFTITIDKTKLVAAALPALLAKLGQKDEATPRKPRARKEPALPGNLPGQTALPVPDLPADAPAPKIPKLDAMAPMKLEQIDAPISAKPTQDPPTSGPGRMGPPPAKSPIHGIAVVTRPGETLAAAKERVRAEVEAAKQKALAAEKAEPAVTA